MGLIMINILNKYCFAKWHGNNCERCIFKKCKKCPIAKLYTYLEYLIISKKRY